METAKKKFSEIKQHYELPEYLKEHIPDDTDIYEVTYSHGEDIADHERKSFEEIKKATGMKKILGIIVSGKAEIYETYSVNKYKVYRPIRLMNAGDFLGDFEIIDDICCDQNNKGISRRGETWKICSGFISILIKQAVNENDLRNFIRVGYREQDLVTSRIINQKTKIVFFDAHLLQKIVLYFCNYFCMLGPVQKCIETP